MSCWTRPPPGLRIKLLPRRGGRFADLLLGCLLRACRVDVLVSFPPAGEDELPERLA